MWPVLLEFLKALPAAIVTGVIAELIAFRILYVIYKEEKPFPKESLRVWIIGIIRGAVIAFYFFGLIIFFNEKWAVTTTIAIIIIVVSVLLIVGFQFIRLRLGRTHKQKIRSPERTDFTLFREVIYLAILLGLFIWMLDRFMPHYISFKCSREVDGKEAIKGLVVKSDWQVRVLVHTISDECWHVQKTPVADSKGHWQTECLFGGPGDEDFQILALASPDSLSMKLGDQVCPDQIPKNARRSEICLTRKRAEK
jgi:hypothetical protein